MQRRDVESPRAGESNRDLNGAKRAGEARAFLRGASLLVSGRFFSLLLSLIIQTLIVRSFAKSDYGAFAYGLSVAAIATSFVLLGLDKTISRFVAVHQERDEHPKALGTILVAFSIVLVLGLLVVAGVFVLQEELAGSIVKNPDALALLLILIVLGPIDALDGLLGSVAAVVLGARAIFFRRHVLRPGLRLIAVIAVIAVSGNIVLLGQAYVVAALLGMVLHFTLLLRVYRDRVGTRNIRASAAHLPVKAVLSYSLPLIVTEVVVLTVSSVGVLLLEYFRDPAAVADFRAVMPVARLNLVVQQSISPLYIPIIARFFARHDRQGINDIYWRTATWIAVLTFPVVVLTVAFAEPVSVLLFGASYASSGPLLAVMAIGFYISAAMGFNSYTFRVCGPARYLVAIDLTSAVVGIGMTVLLVQRYGAMGAAVGTMFTVILRNLLMHTGLVLANTGVHLLEWSHLRVYVIIAAVMAALTSIQLVVDLPLVAGMVLTGLSFVLLLRMTRTHLDVKNTFPELLRVPLLRQLLTDGSDYSLQRPGPTFLADRVDARNEAVHSSYQAGQRRPDRGDHSQAAWSAFELPRSNVDRHKVGYLVSRFPKLTETFVLYEMLAIQELGVRVELYPLRRERQPVMHPEAVEWVRRAHFLPYLSWPILRANLHFLRRSPGRFIRLLPDLLRHTWGSGNFMLGAVVYFPKAVRFAYEMERRGVTHVHAHFCNHPAMVAYIINRLTGIPYSFTAHGSDLHVDRRMLGAKLEAASFAVAISEFNRQIMATECSEAAADRIHVIHCGVDVEEFAPSTTERLADSDSGVIRLVCVGSFEEVKGHRHLIAACGMLRDRGVRFTCELAGDGPLRREMEKLIARLELEDVVHVLGGRTRLEVAGLMREADIAVLASQPTRDGRREGIPVVLIEAMASGLPVVASRLSGIPELVAEGDTGLLVPPGNSLALADALEQLASSPGMRQRMGASGRKRVERYFDLRSNAAVLLNLILGMGSDVRVPSRVDEQCEKTVLAR